MDENANISSGGGDGRTGEFPDRSNFIFQFILK